MSQAEIKGVNIKIIKIGILATRKKLEETAERWQVFSAYQNTMYERKAPDSSFYSISTKLGAKIHYSSVFHRLGIIHTVDNLDFSCDTLQYAIIHGNNSKLLK